jgi:carbamoyl-phosphate synthase large subunit
LREKGCSEALVQEFIAGERFAVAAVCDRQHRAVSTLAIKKLRTCDRGSTWSAISVDQPALQAGFAEYLKGLQWVGPAEGEFIRDEVCEQFQLIEVNPRFTAWISFSANLGLNHPHAAARLAMGLAVEFRPAVKDLVFMRSCHDAPIINTAVAAIATKGVIRHG